MRFSVRKLLIVVTCLSLCIGGTCWLRRWPRVQVPASELDKKKEVRLTTSIESNDVLELELRVRGHLDGAATLVLPWDSQELDVGPGVFSQYLYHDYYDNEAIILYEPDSAKNGNLVIEYRFSGNFWSFLSP